MKYLICLDHSRFLVATDGFIDTTSDSSRATNYISESEVALQVRSVIARAPETYIQIIPR